MLIEVRHEADENGNVFTLREDIEIKWNGKSILIGAGFKSDGASVPRFFWRAVFPPGDNRAMRAAFAHDYIYRNHPEGWTKAEADRMFYELLIRGGIPEIRAVLAWLGVKLFGGTAWEAGGGAGNANNGYDGYNGYDGRERALHAETREAGNADKEVRHE